MRGVGTHVFWITLWTSFSDPRENRLIWPFGRNITQITFRHTELFSNASFFWSFNSRLEYHKVVSVILTNVDNYVNFISSKHCDIFVTVVCSKWNYFTFSIFNVFRSWIPAEVADCLLQDQKQIDLHQQLEQSVKEEIFVYLCNMSKSELTSLSSSSVPKYLSIMSKAFW